MKISRFSLYTFSGLIFLNIMKQYDLILNLHDISDIKAIDWNQNINNEFILHASIGIVSKIKIHLEGIMEIIFDNGSLLLDVNHKKINIITQDE